MTFDAGQHLVTDISDYLASFGTRLRAERERLDLNQAEFGQAGGVNRSSQAEYEGGKRPCSAAYLGHLIAAGVDLPFVVTGARSAEHLTPDVETYAALSPRIGEQQKAALLTLAQAAAQVEEKATPTVTPPAALPDQAALERGYLGLLIASRHMDEAGLARELAKRLPRMLEVLRGPSTTEQTDEVPAGVPASDRRERRRA